MRSEKGHDYIGFLRQLCQEVCAHYTQLKKGKELDAKVKKLMDCYDLIIKDEQFGLIENSGMHDRSVRYLIVLQQLGDEFLQNLDVAPYNLWLITSNSRFQFDIKNQKEYSELILEQLMNLIDRENDFALLVKEKKRLNPYYVEKFITVTN